MLTVKAPHPLNLIAPLIMIELRQIGFIEVNGLGLSDCPHVHALMLLCGFWSTSRQRPQRIFKVWFPRSQDSANSGLPLPLGRGDCDTRSKKGRSRHRNPSCIGFAVLGGGLRPWSQTMVSEWARPWGRGRSEFA